MAADVFEDDPSESCPELTAHSGDMGPQVSGIVCPASFARRAERLAWVSGKYGVDRSGKRSGVEGCEVVPDGGRGQVSCPLGSDEDVPGVFVPFNVGAGVEARLGKHDAHIQSSAACAEGQSVPGT
ncbi:hypothetical protein JANAI62_03490 [Jannaschia pagri]|uniref:Uncharacterized protein n=1 Tax=Jannaschia pagri TaxID=2829797 RepID=A0ABQ4NH22_9RHOB|nr:MULTISPECIES: hypothetical protein [unclassified Jannaschia]GIT90168.1 hypothetical protein JANAI61_06260 [Jannaschia sp. AI_61]GIT93726.1 hypothetical protein JANAI62_03490 [Jannaschia sp. AI_62]